MEFEFDARKSESNRKKHGIDFVEAQDLWHDPDALDMPAKTKDEHRSVVIGRMGEKYWTAVVTCRNERTRIISVRSARKGEKELYESQGI
ncbi:MAG: BrnT family toxin [bacterium]